MILQGLLTLVGKLLGLVLGVINIPSFAPETVNQIGEIIDLIVVNASTLIGLFVRWSTVKMLLPFLLALIFFEQLYGVIMWIVRKIPMLGMS